MANIYGRQFNLTIEPVQVSLFLRATIGAAGAPTLVTSKSKGIKSIAQTATGTYTITFGNSSAIQDYVKLFMVHSVFDTTAVGSAVAPVAPIAAVITDAVTAGTVQVKFFDYAGVVGNPASGEVMMLRIDLGNSTAY